MPIETPVNCYEDFEPGRRFAHHWGRTIALAEALDFATQHMLHEPALLNRLSAQHLGYRDLLVSPLLVFAVVLGMSVEDLSESGGPFLGADEVAHAAPVFPGDTLFASSAVLARRVSKSRPGFGVVQWQTVGANQQAERVISFRRSNLVRFREPV